MNTVNTQKPSLQTQHSPPPPPIYSSSSFHQPDHYHPLLTPLPPLDHRLDIAPSPSPPSHLHLHHHHHLNHHHQQQQHQQQPQQRTHPAPSPPVVPPQYSPHSPPTLNTPYSPIDLLASFKPSLMNLTPPPPPKKRDRNSGSDQNASSNNSTNDQAMHLRTRRAPKKEKPAPVTMVYRGAPDNHTGPIHDHLIKAQINPSMAALPPQTAINRDMLVDHQAPPSTNAPSYSLSHATELSLMKKKHNRLRDLCRDRALLSASRELTKREMVQALLAWREVNVSQRDTSGLSESEDLSMSSASGYDTDDCSVRSVIEERSFDDSIDPQLYSPALNPQIYNLRPRHALQSPPEPQDQTVRGSSQPRTRMALPTNFNLNVAHSPQTQLANVFAATGLQNQPSAGQLDPSILNLTRIPPSQQASMNSPSETAVVMSHPPMIPLLDDPSRNSKRRSIRLVGTKVPSIGPIGKMSMSSINVGGDGPMSIVEPMTMKGTQALSTAVAPNGTIVMKSSSPPSPPASTETQDGEASPDSNRQRPRPSPPEDLDVLLDLEDLKLSDKEIPPEKLAREHKVGSGSFKDVYMGRYRNFRVAICDLRGRLTDMDIKELGLLRDLRHPNIVRFIGVSVGGSVPCTIVTELCRNGDLYDYIRKIPCPPFTQILAMMLDAARGVEYLHLRTPSIIHRDLKSPNVLITANGSAKITDFGLARVKRDVMSMCATTCGTLNWQAPELWVAHPSYNHSIDVYALGLVFWEVLCWPFKEKTYPFQGMNEHAIFAEVGRNRHRPSTSIIRRKWGREIVALIERMWEDDSEARPGMPDVTRLLNAMLLQEREKAWAAHNSGP